MANAADIVQGFLTCQEALPLLQLNPALGEAQAIPKMLSQALHDTVPFLCEAREGSVALLFCLQWMWISGWLHFESPGEHQFWLIQTPLCWVQWAKRTWQIPEKLFLSYLIKACAIQDNTEREAETALVTLMNYEKFDLIKVLLRNQLTIVWCTRLANAQDDDEKMRIEVSTGCTLSGPLQGPRRC